MGPEDSPPEAAISPGLGILTTRTRGRAAISPDMGILTTRTRRVGQRFRQALPGALGALADCGSSFGGCSKVE